MVNRNMNRKGQFYLFAAFVLILSVFLIVSRRPSITLENVDQYQYMFDNYDYEARVVVNNALMENLNVTAQLMNFTENFIDYASNKDLDIGTVFFISRDNKINIVNYLNEPILITTVDETINPGKEIEINYTGSVEMLYSNETYDFSFSQSQLTELKILFVKEGD